MTKELALIALAALVLTVPVLGHGEAQVRIYGPGGPAPAMKNVAALYQERTGVPVSVTAGPPPRWMPEAREQADALFSGSQNMMDAFLAAHPDLDSASVTALYLRPSTILVRPGNPKDIGGIADLLEPGLRIMVVQGAGQVGLWEDVVGRTRDVANLQRFRDNIVVHAPNSGAARTRWKEDTSLDAWLIWNHWEIDNPGIAEQVAVEPELAIYRDTAIAITRKGTANPALPAFLEFLTGPEGEAIFERHGWQKRF